MLTDIGRMLHRATPALLKGSSRPLQPYFEQTRLSRRSTKMKSWHVAERAHCLQFLTPENQKFLNEYAEKHYKDKSPLIEQPFERETWKPGLRRTGLICRKIGIIPQWLMNGVRVQTTLLQVVDNHVINYIDPDTWYKNTLIGRIRAKAPMGRPMGCCVVGADSGDPQWFKAQYRSLFEKAGCMPKKRLSSFAIAPEAKIQPGTRLYATHFRVGQYVDCFSKTTGHGFQGAVVRWQFRVKPCKYRHSTKYARTPGAIGMRAEKSVRVGRKMPGHMGCESRSARGLKIYRINTKYNVLYVRGTVPGPIHHYVVVKDSAVAKKVVENPPFPTHFPEEDKEPLPEELFDPEVFQFSEPSINYDHLPDIEITPVYAKVKRQAKAKK